MDKKALSDLTVFNKYAKYSPSLGRRENFKEIIDRNKEMHKVKFPHMAEQIDQVYNDFVYPKKVLPSMRSLQFGGKPILMAENRIFNCLAKSTKFVTGQGIKSFGDFNDGDWVTVMTDKGRWRPAIVRSHGEQQLQKITFARGRHQSSTLATADHRWLLDDGTVTTSLKVGDKLKPVDPVFENFSYDAATAAEQLWWCYGFVYGDGTVVNKGKPSEASMVRLCRHKADYLSRFTNAGFTHSFPPSCDKDPIVYTGKYTKTLPESGSDTNLIRAFVAGYLDADGSKSTQLTMQASDPAAQDFIRTMFPVAGVFVTSERVVSKETNYGNNSGIVFGLTKRFVQTKAHVFSVQSIEPAQRELVWCLEVEEDASFVLDSGAVTGNCSYFPAESTKFFSELMFLLLGGTGVGYSVQYRHVDKLPKIKAPESDQEYKFQIQDSIIGWSDAIKVVSKAFFNAGTLPIFDYRDIREKGSDLITSGGKAPGPDPLRACIETIIPIFRNAVGRKLRPIEVHDIACAVADSVLAGGIRRAAMICLFDRDDEMMLTCKSGTWYIDHPARARANNSAVLPRGEVKKAEFMALMKRIEQSGCGEPGVYWTNNEDWGTNPSLRKGTKVLTTDGIFPIEELQDQEFVVKNLDGRLSTAKCWLSGKGKRLYELKLSTGMSYFATAEHEWPVISGSGVTKVKTPDLKPNDRLPVIKEHSLFQGSTGGRDDGFFIGWLLGDGWRTVRSDSGSVQTGMVVAKCKIEVKAKLEEYLVSLGVNAKFNPRDNGTYEMNTCNKSLDNIVDSFEFDASKTRIPKALFTKATEEARKGFIDGLFSSDGHIEKGKRRVSLSSSRRSLLEDVAELLGFYGIRSTISDGQTVLNGKVFKKHSLRISDATSIQHFRECFTLSSAAKQAALDTYDLSIKTTPKTSVKVVEVIATDLYEDVWDISVFDETHCFQLSHCITGNCVEIGLRPYQMCNLTEINAGAITDQASFNAVSRAAAFIGTLQAGYTDFHYLNPKWKIACEKDALLGVSMTGIASGTLEGLSAEEAASHAVAQNAETAADIGINPAARVTAVKPAGSTSLVLGTSSGIHAWHAPYYIRRMRAGKDEALAQYMMRAVPELVEEDVMNAKQVVLSFPQKAPDGATVRTESMHSLLDRVKYISDHWVATGHRRGDNKHNVSCTISVKDDEWSALGEWMWEHRKSYGGISVLPYFGAEAYPQLPFEDITEERYNELLPFLGKIDISQVFENNGRDVNLAAELACSGGACEIQF